MAIPDGHIHVMPTDREHIESKDCWCSPEISYRDEFTEKEVWVHREFQ